MGNYHAQFLGGKGVERPLLYPVLFALNGDTQYIDEQERISIRKRGYLII
jgi:hypothetical protein